MPARSSDCGTNTPGLASSADDHPDQSPDRTGHRHARCAVLLRPDILATGKSLGLDGFRWYVLGRGGVMGDVTSDVVRAAFGFFHPAVIDKIWNSARQTLAPGAAGQQYFDCCGELGAKRLAGVAGLDAYIDAADTVIANAGRAAMPLFAGIATQQCADDPAAMALQKAAVLRELRGSAHLCAVVASGLDDSVAHAIKRPNDTKTFGWDPAPEIPAGAQAQLARAEDLTDEILSPAFAALSAVDVRVEGAVGRATGHLQTSNGCAPGSHLEESRAVHRSRTKDPTPVLDWEVVPRHCHEWMLDQSPVPFPPVGVRTGLCGLYLWKLHHLGGGLVGRGGRGSQPA
jgi:hypothetical protein